MAQFMFTSGHLKFIRDQTPRFVAIPTKVFLECTMTHPSESRLAHLYRAQRTKRNGYDPRKVRRARRTLARDFWQQWKEATDTRDEMHYRRIAIWWQWRSRYATR